MNQTEQRTAPMHLLWVLRACVVGAFGLSAYLLGVALDQRDLPPGCGPGTGCESVLASQWAYAFGVPVSGLALVVYGLMLLGLNHVSPSRPKGNRDAGWRVLAVLSGTAMAAAGWFTFVQLAVVRSVCPWCMGTHALGVAAAVGVLYLAWTGRVMPRQLTAGLVAVGITAVVAMAMSQVFTAPTAQPLHRVLSPGSVQTGPGTTRQISLLNGNLELDVSEAPIVGRPDAAHLLLVMSDYACPHCQLLNGFLQQARQRYGDQIAILTLPTPLNSDCNPYIQRTGRLFEDSCSLARLAIAVWLANPQQFADYHDWLFASSQPRGREQALQQAVSMVGGPALEQAIMDPRVMEQISRNTRAYGESGIERLPMVLNPDFGVLVGRPENAEQLFELLETDLGLVAGE